MKRVRPVMWIGIGLLFVWVASTAAPSPPPVPAVELAQIDQAAPSAAGLKDEAARLRAHLAHPPPFPAPVRDPFNFAAPRPTPAAPPAPLPTAAPIPTVVNEPLTPPAPIVPRLVAILADAGSGEIVRSVVLAVGDDVHVGRAGGTIGRYVVRSIDASSAELTETSSGTVIRLSLR